MANLLQDLGISKKKWIAENVDPSRQITQADTYMYGADTTTVATLLGTGRRTARTRQQIYDKWAQMEADPICSSALMLLTTTALGGHETTGQSVFIEKTPEAEKDKRLSKLVEELNDSLIEEFNRIAYTAGYVGSAFGDSYARIYADGRGVTELYVDELVRPQLVQPFERGGRTVGYALYTGERNFERLDVTQMARFKMPRSQWVPQHGVVEKSLRMAIAEDDVDKLPLMPSLAGGSMLYNAEEAYDNLMASLTGLVGQRWMDSIDEQMISINMDSMTADQQKRFLDSIKTMLKKSKELAEKAVKEGRPIMERVRHLVPSNGEKQITQIGQSSGPGRNGTISIDDIMVHARLLSGALGVDLSMLGFADQLSGGLGDGGFFRVSAQAAERTRVVRAALIDFFNQVIDIHTLKKYGVVFPKKNQPWQINFYGSISALEAEKQRTRGESMNAGMLMVQAMQMFKDLGADLEMMRSFLTKQLMLDEDESELFAKIVDMKKDDEGGF